MVLDICVAPIVPEIPEAATLPAEPVILVVNVPELFAKTHERWQEQMNARETEWQELNQRR